MKKRVLAIILCMPIALGVVGCSSNNCRNSAEEHILETIGEDTEYEIFYDRTQRLCIVGHTGAELLQCIMQTVH